MDIKDAVMFLTEEVLTEYCLFLKEQQILPLLIFLGTIRDTNRNGEA